MGYRRDAVRQESGPGLARSTGFAGGAEGRFLGYLLWIVGTGGTVPRYLVRIVTKYRPTVYFPRYLVPVPSPFAANYCRTGNQGFAHEQRMGQARQVRDGLYGVHVPRYLTFRPRAELPPRTQRSVSERSKET